MNRHNSLLRMVRWSIYLLAIPEHSSDNEFVEQYKLKRQEYIDHKDKLFDKQVELSEEDLKSNLHGYRKKEGYWNVMQVTGDQEQLDLKTVHRDIERTFSNRHYFQHHSTHRMLERILVVYLTDSGEVYQQGMPDLLGVLVIIGRRDIKKLLTEEMDKHDCYLKNELWNDEQWLEHDVYILFVALMRFVAPYYTSASLLNNQMNKNSTKDNDDDEDDTDNKITEVEPALYTKIKLVYHKMLPILDPALYTHLESIEILPHLYMLRWFRLLFVREFSLEQLLRLWDSIFACQFHLVDYVAISMLSALRNDIFAVSQSQTMGLLMRYPKVDNHRFKAICDIAERLFNSQVTDRLLHPVEREEHASSFDSIKADLFSFLT